MDNCDLFDKDNFLCIYFELIPKLSWLIQMYKGSQTRIETKECLISKYLKKSLGVPKPLANITL